MAKIKYRQKRKWERDTPMFELLHAIRDINATELSRIIEKKTKKTVAPQTIRNWRNNKTRYASSRTERLALAAVDISLLQIPKHKLNEVKALLRVDAAGKKAKLIFQKENEREIRIH